jgi:hypothetical protein
VLACREGQGQHEGNSLGQRPHSSQVAPAHAPALRRRPRARDLPCQPARRAPGPAGAPGRALQDGPGSRPARRSRAGRPRARWRSWRRPAQR